MKRILILQMRPEDATADSEFEAILRVSGLDPEEVHRVRLEQGIPDIKLKDYSAVIAGGSPFDVTTPSYAKSETQKSVETFFDRLFEEIIPADFPFLGCCSGNGLLGKFCGVPISNTFSEPIGSVMISVTHDGEKDPLLTGLPESFLARVGHKEACDSIPENAVLLATSEPCPVQMFRIKKNIYATQFHPEADAHEFVLRIKTYKDYGYFHPDEADELIEAAQKIQTPIPKEILKRFVATYK